MKILLACLAIQLLLSAQSYGDSQFCEEGGTGGRQGAPAATPPGQRGQLDAGDCHEGTEEEPQVAIIEADCLKEGQPCNILTNRCCPGYWCEGGLAATCVRKQ